MAYSEPFLRLVLSGRLGTTEQFSYGLNLIGDGPIPSVVPTGVIDACGEFHDSGIIGSAAVLTTIKLNHIGTDGRYTQDETVLYDFPDPGVVPSPTAKQAFQIATVISLRTTRQRGLATHGRFYIPAPSAGPQSPNQTMSGTDALAVVNQAQTFIEALNTAMDPWRVGLVSNTSFGGAQALVTKVLVGDTFDTMRSRRNQLVETYFDAAIDQPA